MEKIYAKKENKNMQKIIKNTFCNKIIEIFYTKKQKI